MSLRAILASLCASLLLFGCGGGGSSSDTPAATNPGTATGVAITGTVSAPGGTVAFNPPSIVKRMLAEFFGGSAYAALSGLNPVSGATVQLIEIDSSGAQVGAALASATTNASGSFTLTAPAGFTPAPRFVIRALGSGSNRLDAMVTGTNVDVDPATDATRGLVVSSVSSAGGSIASLRTTDVAEVLDTVQNLTHEVDTTAALSASALATALRTAISNQEEANNIVSSIVGAGEITGTVTNAAAQPLAGVTIVVRDFGNWVKRAVAHTDAQGHYSVRVPPGDYILGAINQTASSDASEWWTSTGGAVKQLDAEKITVASASITRDFQLAAGGRIRGKVTTEAGGAALGGIHIQLRDFVNNQIVLVIKTADDGSYRINVTPGSYFVIAENTTLQPFATEAYNPTLNGASNFNDASRLDVTAGGEIVADMSLQDGRLISGLVSDPVAGPLGGVRVRFDDSDDGEHATVQRTNRVGEYRLWLRPGAYLLLARGQSAPADTTTANQTINFSAAVAEVRMLLKDASGNPVSQAKAQLRRGASAAATGNDGDLISKEGSNSDGSVSVFSSATAADDLLELKLDNGKLIGSTIYNGKTRLLSGGTVASGDPIAVTVGSITNLGTVTLPAGGILSGTVTLAGAPKGGIKVQVRNGGSGAGARFVTTRTQSDGTYSVTLPGGTYARVCAIAPGLSSSSCPSLGTASATLAGTYALANNVAVTAGTTNALNFAIP